MITGEAEESLQAAGFTPCGETPDEGCDDEDGSLGPPPRAQARGGGNRTRRPPRTRPSRAVPIELWSSDKRSIGDAVGFMCVHDVPKGVLHAKMASKLGGARGDGSAVLKGAAAERATKGAITTLFDVAEACNARKLTLGLAPEHAASAELVCSLLYLGFQVSPPRKSPLEDIALFLDFDMATPSYPGGHSTDHTCTATSDCSTSAEDDGPLQSETESNSS